MSTSGFLNRLREAGIELWADGDRLRFDAPPGAMTDAVRADLRQRKNEILEFLKKAKEAAESAGAGIPRVQRDAPLALSHAQQRLWFLNQLDSSNASYNVPSTIRFEGPLDVDALRWSLAQLTARHESLRTTFPSTSGRPVQRISEPFVPDLPVIDLEHLPPGRRAEESTRLEREEVSRIFDLERGPLMRTRLIRHDGTTHVLVLTIHHIVTDGWSMGVLLRDLAELYRSRLQGRSPALPELTVQYADFSAWQRERMQGDILDRQLAYWKVQLDQLPPFQLPTDFPRPPTRAYRGQRLPHILPAPLSGQLRALCQREDATLYMTLLAAFNVLLQRYTGQDDIVVGSPIANRNRGEIEPLVGFFVNSLVMRTDLSGDPSFRDLVARVREVSKGAYANQDLPFELIVEELDPDRDAQLNPLFQVVFAVQNAPMADQSIGDLKMSLGWAETGASRFDLELHVVDQPQGIRLVAVYDTELFHHSSIQRMLSNFETLLQSIVTDPGKPVSRLDMISPDERRRLIREFNDTTVDHPLESCIHTHVEAAVRHWPDAIAVTYDDEVLTYRQLNERANQLARRLRAWDVGPDVLVGLLMTRSTEMVVAMLAVLKAGGAYLPLDPNHPPARVEFTLNDSKCPVLLTQSSIAMAAPRTWTKVFRVDTDFAELRDESTENLSPVGSPDDLAYVLYTSGSTGTPKGVMISHRALCNHMLWMARVYPLTRDDRVLQKTPFTFDASVWEFFAPLMAGARLVMAKPDGHTDPDYLIRVINRQRITVLQLVPSQLRMLLDHGRFDTCGTLRQVFCGGEPLPVALAARCAEATGASVHNLYGPTEATIDTTHWTYSREEIAAIAPIGRPIDNVRAYVLDPRLEPVPIGVPGELHLAGRALGRGYLNQPQLTARKFVDNPLSNDAAYSKLYRTGDLCRYRADGNIEFLGRADDQVKLRGFRIELGEIEATLNRYDGVGESAVVVHPNESGIDRLVAYVVPKKESARATDSSARPSRHESELVAKWKNVHDETVRQSGDNVDAEFNTIGWNSSYTGTAIPEHEMREWVDQTVARILSLKPARVLEIGCGTGLLLSRIAPSCAQYHATDFAEAAVGHVTRLIASRNDLRHVTVSRGEADDAGFAPRSFDTVIINSVVQYFPSIEYLKRVIDRAVEATGPGGRIFIGDIRSLPLLKAFHASVQSRRAGADVTRARLNAQVAQAIEHEEELVISPWFFESLRETNPRIREVEVLIKRGKHHNELSCFRADAVLHVDAVGKGCAHPAELDWEVDQLSQATVEQLLSTATGGALVLRNIPSTRLAECRALLAWLGGENPEATLGEISKRAEVGGAVDPEALCRAAEQLGYRAEISVPRDGGIDMFDAMFVRREPDGRRQPFFCRQAEGRTRPVVANAPTRAKSIRELVPQLRDHLRSRLPEYMVPSTFVVMDSMPHNASGKVDRRALPAPIAASVRGEGDHVAPTTPVEKAVARIWSEVLEIDRIGIHDNFFELGGHSLLATQVISRVREALTSEIPLKVVFECPTVADMATFIETAMRADGRLPMAAVAGGSVEEGEL